MDYSQIINNCKDILKNRCCPNDISNLKVNDILVFGSKPNGIHESGAAKKAVEKFGAIQGLGEGFSGKSYAIPVHKYKTHKMDEAVKKFIGFAKTHSDLSFYVLPVGCGSAGMNVRCVSEMFSSAINVENIFLPSLFIETLMDNRKKRRIIEYTDYPNIDELKRKWYQKLSHIIEKASPYDARLGKIKVEMDCSIDEAVGLIFKMCLPLLKNFYPELQNLKTEQENFFWIKPHIDDVSLAINQITEGWCQCIDYMLGYDWYSPSLKKQDIIDCLTYRIALYGPYFDGFDY